MAVGDAHRLNPSVKVDAIAYDQAAAVQILIPADLAAAKARRMSTCARWGARKPCGRCAAIGEPFAHRWEERGLRPTSRVFSR
jgi:hypothetical protein